MCAASDGQGSPDSERPDGSGLAGGRESFERAQQLAAAGDLQAADEAYRHADEQGHPTAAACVGLFAESRGEVAEAERAYRRADERGDGLGASRLGLLLARRRRWDEAQEAFARAEQRGHEEPAFNVPALLGFSAGAGGTGARSAGSAQPAFTSPVLIGAVTVLVVIIAVFLSYTANVGLPFVPTKELKVNIADGANLVAGNDVVEGGFRIGLVSDLKPMELPNGRVGAQLILKLDQSHGTVPVDSTATILSRSVLGEKYVALNLGPSQQMIPDGGTLPLSHTTVPVQVDDVFDTFNRNTRSSIEQELVGFGDTLTARGSDLNDTIASLPQLLGHLEPVARYLAAPRTELTRFLNATETFMGAVSPVSQTGARLFTDMATTFEAISKNPASLEATISQSPSTLDVATSSLQTQQPFLADLATLGRSLTPASASLGSALPAINPAIEAGTATLRRAPVLNANLQNVLAALGDLARAPGTNVALNGLSATTGTLQPMVRYLGPYVTACDYWNYWWTYLSEHISEATTFGFAQRVLFMFGNATQPNNLNTQGATAPVNGGTTDSPLGGNEFFHSQVYGAAIDNQGNADCENGQRGYPVKLNAFDPQGRAFTTDPHTPGNQGSTFSGTAHVPAGETFTRNPQTGPQLPYTPSNP